MSDGFGKCLTLGTLSLFIFLLGCNGQSTVHVSGKVTYNNSPIQNGLINFLSKEGIRIGSNVAPDGSYSLEAPPGEYRVIVVPTFATPPGWREGDPPPRITSSIPAKYAQPATSGLTATIKEAVNELTLDFSLN